MNRLNTVFTAGRKALIGYYSVGHPSLDLAVDIAVAMAGSGCDIIELGIPFSDPVGDGTTIQHSSYRALQNGATPSFCLETAVRIRSRIETPLVFMTYYNLLFSYGLENFCKDSAAAGVDGFIIPDLPPEEGGQLQAAARKHGLSLIYLLAPTSTGERIAAVAAQASGFIYLVSLTGVTGARRELSADLNAFIQRVRQATDLPLCVGFGISTPEQARQAAATADGIIVGSRLIQLMEEDTTLSSLHHFIAELRHALDTAGTSPGVTKT